MIVSTLVLTASLGILEDRLLLVIPLNLRKETRTSQNHTIRAL